MIHPPHYVSVARDTNANGRNRLRAPTALHSSRLTGPIPVLRRQENSQAALTYTSSRDWLYTCQARTNSNEVGAQYAAYAFSARGPVFAQLTNDSVIWASAIA